MNRGREVLVGKLAIGRRLLERADAVRCFHASNGEPFWELAVREGLLGRGDADDLVRTVDAGSLICRGKCTSIYPLDAARPPQDDKCPTCGGQLYVTSRETAATRDTWKDPGSDGLREAMSAGRSTAPPPEQVKARLAEVRSPQPQTPPRPAPADDTDFAETIPPKPIPLSPFPPRPVFTPTPNTDSLPSAIPIKPRKAADRAAQDETKDEPEAPGPAAPADPNAFKPFTIGTYEVLAPIGKGGMGSVFRARHKALNRVVAIKVFTLHAATDDEQQKRFDREVKTMAKLDHPGIVRVQGGGVVNEPGPYNKRPYYVMEYVAGRDLAAWCRETPRSPGECAAMVAKVCEIVEFFHQRSIIHRDLKPQNVLVSFEGDVPKICDFGLAKVEDSKLTRTGDIMGTPQFMPPEQARGENKKIFTPTDVYSLGAVLYFMLAGEPPYDIVRSSSGRRSPLVDLIERIVREAPPRVRDKNPQVPAALEAIILKCFEKEPPKRFHNARDLGTAIKGLNLPL